MSKQIDNCSDEELFEPQPIQVSYSSGWENTLGDHFKQTSKEVISGSLITVSPLCKEETEEVCVRLSREFHVAIDWYWWRGRSFVKAATSDASLLESIKSGFKLWVAKMADRNEEKNLLISRRMLSVCTPKDGKG